VSRANKKPSEIPAVGNVDLVGVTVERVQSTPTEEGNVVFIVKSSNSHYC
jgi:hypothetical protein